MKHYIKISLIISFAFVNIMNGFSQLDQICNDVIVECEKQDQKIIIRIKDDGPGIDAAARDAVFARGERLDEEKPGTGLGLSIVKDLSGLYGGSIELTDHRKTDHNKGLIATLTLPSV